MTPRRLRVNGDDSRKSMAVNVQKCRFWNDPKIRSIAVQVIMVLVIGFFAYEIVHNTIANLTKRNISTGFAFLNKSAGFDLIQSLIAYSSESSYGQALIAGFLNTLLVSGFGIIFATMIGFFIGIMRLSKNWLVAKHRDALHRGDTQCAAAAADVRLVRRGAETVAGSASRRSILATCFSCRTAASTCPIPIFGDGAWLGLVGLGRLASLAPLLVRRWARTRQAATGQPFPMCLTGIALIWCLPVLGLSASGLADNFRLPDAVAASISAAALTIIPEFMALLLALSIYTGSFIAEVVRAGIQAVSHGQTEAASALGIAQHASRPGWWSSRRPCG